MLSEYLDSAMAQACYELTEQKRYFGTIPVAPGVWSESDNLEACRRELREVLEEWLILSLRRGETLPVIGNCDLNPVAQHA